MAARRTVRALGERFPQCAVIVAILLWAAAALTVVLVPERTSVVAFTIGTAALALLFGVVVMVRRSSPAATSPAATPRRGQDLDPSPAQPTAPSAHAERQDPHRTSPRPRITDSLLDHWRDHLATAPEGPVAVLGSAWAPIAAVAGSTGRRAILLDHETSADDLVPGVERRTAPIRAVDGCFGYDPAPAGTGIAALWVGGPPITLGPDLRVGSLRLVIPHLAPNALIAVPEPALPETRRVVRELATRTVRVADRDDLLVFRLSSEAIA